MTARLRLLAAVISALLLILTAFAAWAIAPFSRDPADWPATVKNLVRAPFSDRIVIGDSRVSFAREPDGALFVGYGGATSRQLERMATIVCAIAPGQVSLALGVNDTKPTELDLGASRAALRRLVLACKREDLWLGQIWPSEAGVEPAGNAYHADAIEELNGYLIELAEAHDAKVLPVPALPEPFTYDGVHFTPEVSRHYAQRLAFPDRLQRAD
ncbi:SGNH/GDSL hydrolase family protein [Qipengyuania flava]|uniref:SGNH/GDSL hydrolase family protein n=1 Tax=Qipengyuania flava TaxID=192812 RepID=UPI001C62CE9E|nr:SGNH/GDSL hydrolase family protein [Qipengyuania flava]QYJ06613.1 SGNH/GDSL hydrolase family protein [Qipengyuania flava]